MNKAFQKDFYRNTGKQWKWYMFYMLFFSYHLRFTMYLRILQNKKLFIFYPIAFVGRYLIGKKHGLDILPQTKIGLGFRMIHPIGISINPESIIGNNVNIYKGATIGFSERKNKGTPSIGNNVQIGINSTVVGKVKIGDDVLIAPNSFINKDVPSHSVVIGSPAVIIPKEDATKEHIFFRV